MSRFDDINHTPQKNKYLDKIKSIREVFNSSSAFLEKFRELQVSGVFSVPSIYSSHSAKCLGSFYHGYNFLVFFDNCENKYFVVVQHNHGAHGIINLDEGWVSAPKAIIKNLNSRDFVFHIESNYEFVLSVFSQGVKTDFLGLIDGYKRPYHYFYDRLACLLSLRNAFPDVKVFSLVNSSFYPAGYDPGFFSVRSTKDLNSKSISTQRLGFFIQSFRFHDYDMEDTRNVLLSNMRHNLISKDLRMLKGSNLLVVWIGLCSEKRSAENVEEIVSRFIVHCLSEAPGYEKEILFIFDGLTCPVGVDEDDFKLNCTKEIEFLEKIRKKVGGFNFLSLIGSKAGEKIQFANCVDFFFSNALTDSIWPSFFGRAPGVAYCSENSDYSVHLHPKTKILDAELVANTDDGGGNWAKESFSLSISDSILLLKESFHPLLENNKERFLFELSNAEGKAYQSGVVKILFHKFSLVVDLLLSKPDLSKCYEMASKFVVEFYDQSGFCVGDYISPVMKCLEVSAPGGAVSFCLYIDVPGDVIIGEESGFYFYPVSNG